jgi:hypothetical protein
MGMFDAVGQMFGIGDSTGDKAMAAQKAGAAGADAAQQKGLDQTRTDNAPYLQAGYGALSSMQDKSFNHSFGAEDFHQQPGYQFAMEQGQQALERSAAAKGGALSGGTLKALTQYGQNTADQQYQQAFNNYQTDTTNRYGRLSAVAGMGQNAANVDASANMNYANQNAQTAMGLGNAGAAQAVGQANRDGQSLQQGISLAAMFCDKRLKTDIEAVSKEELAELKSCIKAYRFRYKDENHGVGDYIGPMAQDLQKCKLGRGLVAEDKDGHLTVDVGRTMMLVLASWAEA